MPFQQRAGSPEFVENLVLGHARQSDRCLLGGIAEPRRAREAPVTSTACPPIRFTRCTELITGLCLSWLMMALRCFRFQTSRSITTSRKSDDAFASHGDAVDVAVIVADDLGDLGQRAGLVDRRHGDLRREALGLAFVDVPAHVQPAVRLVVERGQRRGLDRIDRDPLPGSRMPTIRSPGTAPPFGAKRTGSSPLMPLIGIDFGVGLVLGRSEAGT